MNIAQKYMMIGGYNIYRTDSTFLKKIEEKIKKHIDDIKRWTIIKNEKKVKGVKKHINMKKSYKYK